MAWRSVDEGQQMIHERLLLGSSGVTGGPHWIATFALGGGYDVYPADVTVDASGNVYALLWSPVTQIQYVCKFNSAGVLQWQKGAGGDGSRPQMFAIDVDSSGNVYIGGCYGDIFSSRNMTVHKWNSSGDMVWRRNLTDGWSRGTITGVKVDASGDVYLSGYILIDPGFKQYIGKLNSSGVPQWHRAFGGFNIFPESYDVAFGCAIDSSSNVYVVGRFDDAIGASLIKYNSSGTYQWHTQLDDGTYSDSVNYGVATDSSGNVFTCGRFGPNNNSAEALIAKYNSSGALQWQRGLGSGSSNDQAHAVQADPSGNIFVTGLNTGSNAFIAKYSTSGSLLWQRKVNAIPNTDIRTGVATDALGNGYLIAMGDSGGMGAGALICKLPSGGELTGTYTVGTRTIVYQNATMTAYSTGLAAYSNAWSSITASIGTNSGAPSTSPSSFNSAVTTL